jgi:hypothetical protein
MRDLVDKCKPITNQNAPKKRKEPRQEEALAATKTPAEPRLVSDTEPVEEV